MDLFHSLKRCITPKDVCDDDSAFRLHYRITFGILIACSTIVTARQYFGDPIDCIAEGVPPNIMDSYCWFSSTFVVKNRMEGVVGKDFVRPGLVNAIDEVDHLKYFRYYQWVSIVLAFQAIFFYFPRYLWKNFENGRMRTLTQDITYLIVEDDIKNNRINVLVNYINDNWNHQNAYIFHYFFCKMLNFLNVIGQFYVMNIFLNGDFLFYGIDILTQTNGGDPMDGAFPKMTKCTFHQYGPSGSVKLHDGLCILAVNVINEKIYVVLWFWFIGLAVVSGLSLIFDLIVLTVPRIRYYLLRARARWTSTQDIQLILGESCVGDWFILYQLSKNVNSFIYKELCGLLVKSMNKKIDV